MLFTKKVIKKKKEKKGISDVSFIFLYILKRERTLLIAQSNQVTLGEWKAGKIGNSEDGLRVKE